MGSRLIAALAAALILAGCQQGASQENPEGAVNRERIIAAGTDGANWLTTGRTYDEQRHSPLNAINRENVSQLGLPQLASSSGRSPAADFATVSGGSQQVIIGDSTWP